jgi:putative membrane protein
LQRQRVGWYHVVLMAGFLLIFLWSAYRPVNQFTWFLEVSPALCGFVLLVTTYRRFPWTSLTYTLIFFASILLLVGGPYTYGDVPLFDRIQETWNLDRNHYDRFGHFFQGFMPAIVSRELLLRSSPLQPGKWLNFIIICIVLAVSASYELCEFAVAKLIGAAAESFLGTQGDAWDTQWDMLFALIGAILSLLLWSRYHDKQLKKTMGDSGI